MVKLENLIHDEKFFQLEYIKEQQKQYKFTQAVKVETFLWDLEIYGQLQKVLGDKVILKGGAAAQLFVPPERQRTSVDIDVIFVGKLKELENALNLIHRDFGNDEVFFNFQKFTPKNQKTTLPLETYTVAVPTISSSQRPIIIKVDFHLFDGLDLETVRLGDASAFVIPLNFKPLCLSPASLVGDKLLTLARGSVGIPSDREYDIPKQLYDLDNLTRIIPENGIGFIMKAEQALFERELSDRGMKATLKEARGQMIDLLERYCWLDSPKGEATARKVIKDFKGNYEPGPFKSVIQWAALARRLQFLVKCLRQEIESNPLVHLARADALERAVGSGFNSQVARTAILKNLRGEFVRMMEADRDTLKRLKNAPLERILWEIVTPTNLDDVEAIVSKRIENNQRKPYDS